MCITKPRPFLFPSPELILEKKKILMIVDGGRQIIFPSCLNGFMNHTHDVCQFKRSFSKSRNMQLVIKLTRCKTVKIRTHCIGGHVGVGDVCWARWCNSLNSSTQKKMRLYFRQTLTLLTWNIYLLNWLCVICEVHCTIQAGYKDDLSFCIHYRTKFFSNKVPWVPPEEARPLSMGNYQMFENNNGGSSSG